MNVNYQNGFYVLDLHGVYHADVADELDAFLYAYQEQSVLKIECGNSERMKKLVIDYLETHHHKWMQSIGGGFGTISVVESYPSSHYLCPKINRPRK